MNSWDYPGNTNGKTKIYAQGLLQIRAIHFLSKILCILTLWWYFADCDFGSEMIFVHHGRAQNPFCPLVLNILLCESYILSLLPMLFPELHFCISLKASSMVILSWNANQYVVCFIFLWKKWDIWPFNHWFQTFPRFIMFTKIGKII